MRVNQPSEFNLIRLLCKKTGNKKIGDDCAVVQGRPGYYSLLTVDAFVNGVHFDLKYFTPRDAGKKCASAALSDIAAMAGRPHTVLVSLGLPLSFEKKEIIRFYDGLISVCKKYAVTIEGGNITRSRVFWADIVVMGEVAKKKCKFRRGARSGDGIFVTGPLGGAAQKRYRIIPVPRLDFGHFLGKMREVTSMIDVSDGLASDLGHILQASKCGAQIFYDQIPRAKGARAELVLSGGEDYELLFTARPGAESKLRRFFKIGEITKGRGLKILDKEGREIKLKRKGYDHFR